MPKLLQINSTANWGSTGRIAEAIGVVSIELGWESSIAYGRNSNPSQSNLIKVGGQLTPYLHFVQQYFFDNEGLCSENATRQLISKIDSIAPNIIHLHNIHDHWLNFPLLFEYLNGTDIRVVWTFHDCWAFTGHCFHFVRSNCMKWKDECCDCPQRNKYRDASSRNYNLKKALFAANRNLTIVPVSQWLSNFVKESFLKDKRMCVIHNGIDLKVFKPQRGQTMNATFRILAVSNVWHQSKGLYDIFKLREVLPSEFSITIVGLSSKQLENLPDGIDGILRTQNVQELVELYSNVDVFINPTYADTFPTVNIEALACGTPVITYNTGGSPEAIDEKTGIVVPQGDVNALAEAIKRMAVSPLSADDCRKRAEEHFDKDKCFRQYIALYEELLEKD